MFEIRQAIYFVLLTLFINQCSSQTGFPKQFQTTLNITGLQSYTTLGIQQLLYDYTNSRVRFDIKGWRLKQNETYMVQYKPKGAEPNTVNKNNAFLYGKNARICFLCSRLQRIMQCSTTILIIQNGQRYGGNSFSLYHFYLFFKEQLLVQNKSNERCRSVPDHMVC